MSDVFCKKIFYKNAFFSRNSKALTTLYSTKYIHSAVLLSARTRFKQNTDLCKIFRITFKNGEKIPTGFKKGCAVMEKDVTRKNMNAMWDELKNDIWCQDWLRKCFELTIAEIELFQALEEGERSAKQKGWLPAIEVLKKLMKP